MNIGFNIRDLGYFRSDVGDRLNLLNNIGGVRIGAYGHFNRTVQFLLNLNKAHHGPVETALLYFGEIAALVFEVNNVLRQ